MQPAEIWQESGRWDAIGGEMFRLKDRKGADMALAMTHEEVVTWLAAREVHSYKQLPQMWYHIQTKERDEARPKSGILRTREFMHEGLLQSRRRAKRRCRRATGCTSAPTTASTRAAASTA